MAQTEITVQVFENIEKIKEKLENLGYVWNEKFSGTDQYFSTFSSQKVKKSSYKELLDSSVIIREFDKQSTGLHQIMLVHKKKNIDKEGRVVGEEKTSLFIDNSETASKLLLNAGLVNWMSLSQENNFYSKGEIVVIAGTVNGLEGSFIEIEEYPSIKGFSETEKFNILFGLVNSFGFKTGEDYSCKKIYMLYEQNKQK